MEIYVLYKDLYFLEYFEEILFFLVQKVDFGVLDVYIFGQFFIYLFYIFFYVFFDVFVKIFFFKDFQYFSCNV